jgi:hypothetical protein
VRMRTEKEIRHAIARLDAARDGLRQLRLFAHVIIAAQAVETLKWMLGEPSTFGATLDRIDAEVHAALAHTN